MSALYYVLSREIAMELGWTLFHSIWQTAVIGAVLGALLKLLHRAGANLRYALACAALAWVVLWPVLSSGIVSVPFRRASVPIERTGQTPQAVAVARQESTPQSSAPAVVARPERVRTRSWKDDVVRMVRPILPSAVLVWLIGVTALSLWHVGGWGRLELFRRRQTRSVSRQLRDRMESLARAMRIKRMVRLAESVLVQVPSVIGWLRPMILLPASALTALPPQQLEALLAHELAHIRRHDYLVNILQTVVEILGFYHPVVWWISRQIRIERENCCDDVAAKAIGDRLQYARALAFMEDIRAGRPELVLAASGGSLLARIRRLVGRTPTENRPSPWAPALAAAALVFSLVIPAGLAIADYATNPATELERQVLKGFTENRAKFTCGVLAWTHTVESNGFSLSAPEGGLKYGGQYRMWWDRDKVATKYTKEGVHGSKTVPPPANQMSWKRSDGMTFWIGRSEGSNVYTGGLLAREPRWQPYENWLGDVSGWRGMGSRDRLIIETGRMKHMAVEWSTVDIDGDKLIRRVAKNMNTADYDYGGYSIEYYDPARGCGLVREDWYTASGTRRLHHTVKLKEVVPGAWFPVEVVQESGEQGGPLPTRNQMALDLAQCRFNDKSALTAGVFEMLPRQEQDELRKTLGDVVQKQTADAETKTQAARGAVEGFITAAMKGEYERAAKFASPKQPMDDVKEFKELMSGQDLNVVAAFADDKAALVVTSAIRADHGRAGPLTFSLVKSPDAQAGWLIDDIDVETPQGAGQEIERFLQEHPAAARWGK